MALLAGVIAGQPLWAPVRRAGQTEPTPDSITRERSERGLPADALALRLDRAALDALLRDAPDEAQLRSRDTPAVRLQLPDRLGRLRAFAVWQVPVMEPALAARYPQILAFAGTGTDEPALTARFTVSPRGLSGIVRAPGQSPLVIEPANKDTPAALHLVYHRSELRPGPDLEGLACRNDEGHRSAIIEPSVSPRSSLGTELKVYRAAFAATYEYSNYHSTANPPDKADVLAAIATGINRLNEIYEREAAIRLLLVADNDDIIYTSFSDPYSSSVFDMLLQNQTNLDNVIGSGNYDIGHVLGGSGGSGIAYVGTPCRSNWKARGVSSYGNPIGEIFWVDLVSHEVGHQWGADHSFNGTAGSCSNNRAPLSAWEPGSGSTIMSYVGECGSQNLQSLADDNLHAGTFESIRSYLINGSGATCGQGIPTGNAVPTVDAGPSFWVPASTPFALCGSASDPDSATLTYRWEEIDLGPAGSPWVPSGSAPIFRSFPPASSPRRTFPRRENILGDFSTIGEILPAYDRRLNFRLTVNDNRPGGSGINNDSTWVDVEAGAGPFELTSQGLPSLWVPGTQQTVAWSVANTDLAPFFCSDVLIELSTDRGESFPLLLRRTPNDGLAQITVPNVGTTQGRLRISCPGSIFFDLNKADITILGSGSIVAYLGFDDCESSGGWDLVTEP